MHSVIEPIATSSSSVLASEFALHREPNLYLGPAELLLQAYRLTGPDRETGTEPGRTA